MWTVSVVLRKVNTVLPSDPAIPLLSIHERNKNRCSNKYLHVNVHSSTLHNNQKMETTQGPSRWMDQ